MTRFAARRALVHAAGWLFALAAPGLFGQVVSIAEISMARPAQARMEYPSVAATVGRFDVVAASDIHDAGDMEKVLAGMDDSWAALLSHDGGSLGFFYDDRLQVAKELGTYPVPGQFHHPPYGAQFRLAGTRFVFNVVVCRIDREAPGSEIARLANVYRYFEKLTGSRGITVLAGRFGNGQAGSFASLAAAGGIDVTDMHKAVPGLRTGRIFASTALRPKLDRAGISPMAFNPAFAILKASN